MTVALRKPMTVAEFLVWEARQELRYEFDGFQPVAMTGGTIAHDQISYNIRKALDTRLAGKPCRPHGPNVKIQTAGKVRYPDALVTCTRTDPNATIANEPVVVFEVVSEDTARTDRIVKLREYQATPTIRRYIILEQKSIGAMVFARRDNDWIATALTEGDTLIIPEIDVQLPIDEFYADLDYSSPDETSVAPER